MADTSVRQIRVGKIIGLSAYEIAVKNGSFSGTEEQYSQLMVNNTKDIEGINSELDDIRARLDTLEYVAIAITSFTNNLNTVEISGSSKEVTLSWVLSKDPSTVKIDGVTISGATKTGSTKKTIAGTAPGSTTFKLDVSDSKGNLVSKTTAVNIFNRIYYGVANEPSSYNSAFVTGLQKADLANSRAKTISLTASTNQYYYYCVPKRLGECKFTVGGFEGGFALVDTISVTNASGYTEQYYIYKSDNANLGTNSVVIS